MSKIDKLIAYFQSFPVEAQFSEVKRLLEAFEFQEVRSNGSHHIFRHPDSRMITVPKKSGRAVKRIYIRKLLRLLELENESN